jgi:Domain of unknown function (DUF6968)
MKIEIDEVIARRQLTGMIEGRPVNVVVEIGKPVTQPEGDWFCPYRISAGPQERVFYAAGFDAVQVLYLAFFMIGADLRWGKQFSKFSLKWCDSNDLGSPVPEVAE